MTEDEFERWLSDHLKEIATLSSLEDVRNYVNVAASEYELTDGQHEEFALIVALLVKGKDLQ